MSKHHRVSPREVRSRSLRFENLEDRRLLAVVTVDTNQDVVDFNDGVTSLREALFATNLVGGADEIQFDFGHDGPETIVLTLGELAISDDLTINGPGADLLTIDASGNDPTPDENNGDGSRIFNINDGSSATSIDVELLGLTLTGGDAPGDGGAIFSRENLSVTGSTISGNSARLGGGIYSYGPTTINSSAISGNSATGSGGGIHTRGVMTITDSTIYDNSSNTDGGGVYAVAKRSTVMITGSTFFGNSARNGGGISTRFGNIHILNNTISGNSAQFGGGGISTRDYEQSTVIANSTISGNTAERGGGIIAYGRTSITDSTIAGNTASRGGGVFVHSRGGRNTPPTITGSTISGNSALNGGGLYISSSSSGTTTIEVSTISGNSAQMGGGIFASGNMTITGSTISGNSALNGGGIYAVGNTMIAHSTVTNNVAQDGGGILVRNPELGLSHTIVARNVAPPQSGADISGPVNPSYSLIGNNAGTQLAEAPVGSPDANGNLIGGTVHGVINPRFGLLANNSGPTQTHALLPGSPAINAGDPAFVGPPDHDQRGFPYVRVSGGRIDIGAFESQPLPGDFDGDGDSDGDDLAQWEADYGLNGNSDANGDGHTSGIDFLAWQITFAEPAPPPAPPLVVASDFSEVVRLEPRLVDAALAVGLHETDHFSLGHHVIGRRDAVVVDEVFRRTDFLGPPVSPANRPVARFFRPLLDSRQSTDMSHEMSNALLEAEFAAESFALL